MGDELCTAEHCDCCWGCGDLRDRDAELTRLRARVAELQNSYANLGRVNDMLRDAVELASKQIAELESESRYNAHAAKGGGEDG